MQIWTTCPDLSCVPLIFSAGCRNSVCFAEYILSSSTNPSKIYYRLHFYVMAVGRVVRLLLLLVFAIASEARVGFRFLSLSVSKGTRPRARKVVDEGPALYDEYGSIPQVQNVYCAIGKGRPVAVFRTNNSTVVAIGPRAEANDGTLIISGGCNPFYGLTSPASGLADGGVQQHSILVTGAAGDCRTVVRFAKQLVLNYTMEYSASPSGRYVAERVGGLLQGRLAGGGRMLACHCFVLSTPAQSGSNGNAIYHRDFVINRLNGSSGGPLGTIFEVTAVGGVAQVAGGVAGGPGAPLARQVLQRGLTSPGAVNGTQLAREVLQAAVRGASEDVGDEVVDGVKSRDSGSKGADPYNIFVIPDHPR